MILRQLILLLISINMVIGLCPDMCKCNESLKTVHCNNGNMKEIPVNSMNSDVTTIFIKGDKNDLTVGPIFRSFQNLRELTIIDSNIPSLGFNSFRGLLFLKLLDVSRNNISTLTEESFNGLKNLKYLDLSNNKIDRIPSAAFRHLTRLEDLNLASNLIEELMTRQFFELAHLRNLDLSGNILSTLPFEVFGDIYKLETLKCRRCLLTTIDERNFRQLLFLKELDLGYNKIETINRGVFDENRNLRHLRLDGNQLKTIEEYTFGQQNKLLSLDLAYNELKDLRVGTLDGLYNLTNLDVSYNNIEMLVPEIFEAMRWDGKIQLQSLNLSGNPDLDIDNLQATFEILENLDTLAMADLHVQFPDMLLSSMLNLKFLNISGNRLDGLMLHFLNHVTSLEHLDLSRNEFNGMSETLVSRLLTIPNVILSDNPLICDQCHLGPLLQRVEEIKWNNVPVCAYPSSLRGAPLLLLDPSGLTWCFDVASDDYDVYIHASTSAENALDRVGSAGIYIISGAIILILLLVIILAIYSRNGAKYYTHEDTMGNIEKHHPSESSGNEINFKFPYNEGMCTIDEEVFYMPTPPTPNKQR